MKDLISQNRDWNEEAVRSHFNLYEADYILDIPLSHLDSDDSRYWK